MGNKVYIETYGCTLNQADSDIIANILESDDVSITKDEEKADLIIVNTCTVKKPTEQKILHRLKMLENLEKKVVVTGCMASANQDLVQKYNQNASVVTTNNIESIAGVVKSAVLGQKQVINDYKKIDRLVFASPNSNVISKIAINDGCASSCLFCETKFARGPLNSFSEELIVKAVELSVERGAREIQLASQDTGAYGLDRATNIAKLMLKISKIAGDFKVRIGMLNPEHISKYLDSFIEIMKSEKFYKFVHLPVQSGSNDVLRHMRRMYTIEHFNEYVDRIRAEIPWITVETDIIVGYPAETEQDFEQTLGFVRESRPNIVNMSKFWSRPHTMASKLKQLSQETITERSAELGRVVRKVQKEINDSFVGTISNVLITETEESSFNGRTDNYKKVIIKKKDTDENVFIGNKVRVKIEKASCNVLYARLT